MFKKRPWYYFLKKMECNVQYIDSNNNHKKRVICNGME